MTISTEAFIQAAENAYNALKASTAAGSIALNFFVAGFAAQIIGLINSLQLIVITYTFQLNWPSNASFLMQLLVPVVTFDVLDTQYTSELILDFDYENQVSFNEGLANLKYESNNAVLNIGGLFLFMIIRAGMICLLVITHLLKLIFKPSGDSNLVILHSYLEKNCIYSGVIMLFYEAFLENCISSYLGIMYPLKDSFNDFLGEKISFYLSFVCFGSNIVLLILTLWILTVDENKLSLPKFEKKWNALTDGLKSDKKSRSWSLIFCLRRCIIFATIFFLIDSGTLQV